jgi:phosphoglycolate phosphatase-like HAD superfamily hydrolase
LEIPRRLEQGLPINDIVPFDVQRFLDVYLNTYYSVTRTMTKVVPNAKAAMQVLSEKAKLALITMRFVPKTVVLEELEQFGLAEYFTLLTALDTRRPEAVA